MSGSLELTQRLKAEALRLGFDLVGVAQAHPLDRTFYERWIDAGHAAGLGYMRERLDERLDPAKVVPNARSVIALAMSYHREDRSAGPTGGPPERSGFAAELVSTGTGATGGPATAAATSAGRMRIARYARGRDYHLFLRRRARKLRNRLREWAPGARVHPSVDTSPVAEKVWAELAGLGWVGHNGLLVTQRFGSWVLLGTLITDIELAYDAPHPHRCGACRACLPSCPTGALLGDGQLDARRCLANWTIETRGPIPEAMRAAAGERHFGCDICQEVCPWNRGAAAGGHAEFEPLPVVKLRCSEILRLNQAALADLLVGSPLKRPGIGGFRRDAVLGLVAQAAAQADGEAQASCAELAHDRDPVVRETAAWVGAMLSGTAQR